MAPRKDDPAEWGRDLGHIPEETTEVRRSEARAGQFVHRIYRLVPLTELEDDAYGPGGPCSGQKKPKFREELVTERYFEGIG
jgi:hypothetical protein